MFSRRNFLKSAALTGAGLLVRPLVKNTDSVQAADLPAPIKQKTILFQTQPSLDPTIIPKYVTPLVIPPAMPKTPGSKAGVPSEIDYYEIAVRQFPQQILPTGFNATTVWSYGSANHPTSFNYPAYTIEAIANRPVRVKWINQLVDGQGNFLPHLLSVDQTLHWANPSGGVPQRNSEPVFKTTPGTYTGPVPIVTHVHGSHSQQESDGFAEAWYLPAAKNIPPMFAKTGTFYNYFEGISEKKYKQKWTPGSAVFQYPNDQRATTMWYHDHTLGMTRVNVYAGPAGFYLLRGGSSDLPLGVLPGTAPLPSDPNTIRHFEIPIAIQDRSFNDNGSLFYPNSRDFFDDYTGPFKPQTDVPPIWNPEFFGNAMVVNGNTWPVLTVEARRYRFRFLDGCNSRFVILKMTTAQDPTAPAALPFWQIGTEGGFLPAPVMRETILMSPAERADVIVDFTGLAAGTEIYLLNLGPDEPFAGGEPGDDFEVADPETTGQVMKFVVTNRVGNDDLVPPDQLTLPAVGSLPASTVTRQVSLNEVVSTSSAEFDGPVQALLGTLSGGSPVRMLWNDPITENPVLNATETWEIYNFTVDAHPIHVHEVMFKVVNRQPIDGGTARPPEPWETGWKDTVIAYPGEITRIAAKFDLPGLYVWHCHIVEHEDNEMMRPYFIGPIPANLPL